MACLPARVSQAMHDAHNAKVGRAIAGVALDASVIVAAAVAAAIALAAALTLARRPLAPARAAVAVAVAVWLAVLVSTMVSVQVHAERGDYPTVFDVIASLNPSFVKGTFGFLKDKAVLAPTALAIATLVVGVAAGLARPAPPPRRRRHRVLGLVLGASLLGVPTAVAGEALSTRGQGDVIGEPLRALVESGADLVRYGPSVTPRRLIRALADERDEAMRAAGAALVGWPATSLVSGVSHPAARPLDLAREPAPPGHRGHALRSALSAASRALFQAQPGEEDAKARAPVVVLVMLEGLRADDLFAHNADAPADLAPFLNGLAAQSRQTAAAGDVVLFAEHAYQAGVRTAHGLSAMLCGVGALPFNLAIIRDLQPTAMPAGDDVHGGGLRCLPDVTKDAGFAHTVWYGSDLEFDDMARFFRAHGGFDVVSQRELPPTLPTGTRDAVTDMGLVDAALAGIATRARDRRDQPQLHVVLTLSHHSPFTAPADASEDIKARAAAALARAPRADELDARRLVTYAYADAALARLVTGLAAAGVGDRAIIVVAADHSTGHRYLWGEGRETEAAKAQIPLAFIVPQATLAAAGDEPAARAALATARAGLNAGPISLADLPTLLLAVIDAALDGVPRERRVHTLGGMITSPAFTPIEAGAVIHGVNGVSEVFALDNDGRAVGPLTPSRFVRTSADLRRLTPQLAPAAYAIAAVLEGDPAP